MPRKELTLQEHQQKATESYNRRKVELEAGIIKLTARTEKQKDPKEKERILAIKDRLQAARDALKKNDYLEKARQRFDRGTERAKKK